MLAADQGNLVEVEVPQRLADLLGRLGIAEEAPVSSRRVAAPRQVDEDHSVVRGPLDLDMTACWRRSCVHSRPPA